MGNKLDQVSFKCPVCHRDMQTYKAFEGKKCWRCKKKNLVNGLSSSATATTKSGNNTVVSAAGDRSNDNSNSNTNNNIDSSTEDTTPIITPDEIPDPRTIAEIQKSSTGCGSSVSSVFSVSSVKINQQNHTSAADSDSKQDEHEHEDGDEEEHANHGDNDDDDDDGDDVDNGNVKKDTETGCCDSTLAETPTPTPTPTDLTLFELIPSELLVFANNEDEKEKAPPPTTTTTTTTTNTSEVDANARAAPQPQEQQQETTGAANHNSDPDPVIAANIHVEVNDDEDRKDAESIANNNADTVTDTEDAKETVSKEKDKENENDSRTVVGFTPSLESCSTCIITLREAKLSQFLMNFRANAGLNIDMNNNHNHNGNGSDTGSDTGNDNGVGTTNVFGATRPDFIKAVINHWLRTNGALSDICPADVSSLMLEFYPVTIRVPLRKLPYPCMCLVVQYLRHHNGVMPAEIAKPVRSVIMERIVADKWDAEYINAMTKKTIFQVVLAANYLDLPSLLHLGCAKIATLIKGKSPEEIKNILADDGR